MTREARAPSFGDSSSESEHHYYTLSLDSSSYSTMDNPQIALWTSYTFIALQAIAPITLGSFKSLKGGANPQTPPEVVARRKRARKVTAALTEDEDEDEDEGVEEVLTWGDTLLFPVMGSIALMLLWVVIKYLGREWINRILGVYFTGAGMFAIQSTFSTIANYLLRGFGFKASTYHIRITKNLKQIYHLPITGPALFLIPVSIGIPLAYILLDRPWVLSNTIALSLSVATLALLRLDSFMTAMVLLGVLLIYDIFWVFATPVMVTVARSIDAPIKLVAPKDSSGLDFTMLGLGDVIVPGLMVALCLRFDLHLHAKRNPNVDVTPRSRFAKTYFISAMISYVVGLAVTISVMHYFQKAQPALLYLSPACVFGPVLVALAKGEWQDMWNYSDAPDETAEEGRDETIEAGSEVAQRARAEAKAKAAAEAAEASGADGSAQEEADGKEETEAEDDSWMDNAGVVSARNETPRKRKGKKK